MMKYEPIGSRIAVTRLEQEEVSPGGIIIPDNAKEPPKSGIVTWVGRDCWLVSVGDQVYFSKHTGTEVKVGEEILVIMEEDDCMLRGFEYTEG